MSNIACQKFKCFGNCVLIFTYGCTTFQYLIKFGTKKYILPIITIELKSYQNMDKSNFSQDKGEEKLATIEALNFPTNGNKNSGWTLIKTEVNTGGLNNRIKLIDELLNPCFKSNLEVGLWNLFYLLLINVICIIWSVPVTLVPHHNVIDFPAYWWEPILFGAMIFNSLYETLYTISECKLVFGFSFLNSFLPLFKLLSVTYLATILPSCLSYFLWTSFLGFGHPMPFLGVVLYFCWNVAHFIAIWFLFPYHLRKEHGKRIRSYIIYRLWYLFMVQQKVIFMMMMSFVPTGFQWVMAILLPLIREFNTWVLTKLLDKTANEDISTSQSLILSLTPTISVNISHSLWMAVIISSEASQLTAYLILGADFLLNLYSTFTILRLHRKVSSVDAYEKEKLRIKKTEETFMCFGLETIEATAPIVFFLIFMLAYNGPNAEIIGGIKMDLWQHQPVQDVNAFAKDLFLMFSVEVSVSIISGILLWKFANINFLKEGYKMLVVFWPLASTIMGGQNLQVICLRKFKKILRTLR